MKRDLTIEPAGDGEFMVVEHGEYDRTSVLAGQAKRSRLEYFPTVEAAKAEYPSADVMEHQTGDPFGHTMSDIPPSWFDPSACGEVWHENDY